MHCDVSSPTTEASCSPHAVSGTQIINTLCLVQWVSSLPDLLVGQFFRPFHCSHAEGIDYRPSPLDCIQPHRDYLC